MATALRPTLSAVRRLDKADFGSLETHLDGVIQRVLFGRRADELLKGLKRSIPLPLDDAQRRFIPAGVDNPNATQIQPDGIDLNHCR